MSLHRCSQEMKYVDPRASEKAGGKKRFTFPCIKDAPTLDLSIIIPAKDEELRLPLMLDEALQYLHDRKETQSTFTWEIIIVDDGSTDQTTNLALQYSNKYTTEKVRVLTLVKNRGKGGAVQMGMLSARGRKLLFADADGATKFSDIQLLEQQIERSGLDVCTKPVVVVGSRAHMQEQAVATRSLYRTILMHAFHFIVWLFCVRTVRDTQCGFKLFSRPAAQRLFSNLHVQRWAFDVELLYLAETNKMPIFEIPVTWHEVDGSKITPVITWIQMGVDLILIWGKYTFNVWQYDQNKVLVD